jgi:hypothetical protein
MRIDDLSPVYDAEWTIAVLILNSRSDVCEFPVLEYEESMLFGKGGQPCSSLGSKIRDNVDMSLDNADVRPNS